jgi:uncharacterized membrane protein YkvA (DUF1232 family)
MSERKKASPHVNGGSDGLSGVLDRSRALEPATIRLNEQRVAKGFWPKIRRVAAKIPFASDALSLWFCVRDDDTPFAAKGLIFAALAYFVLPTDFIPDVIAGLGFTDDAAVIAAVLAVVGRNVKPEHRQSAKDMLARMAQPD